MHKPVSAVAVPVENGFGQIMEKGSALKEAVALKTHIEMLIAKDSLTSSDSISLEKAIDSIHDIQVTDD